MKNPEPEIKPQTYKITSQGRLDDSWQHWFANFTIVCEEDSRGRALTTLTGKVSDQAALRGILIKLWDLNLSLDSVQRVD
jgi:hypothetical protein